MKTPLYIIISVVLVCVFCSCERTYYHKETAFPGLQGPVKKVADSVYRVSAQYPDDLCLIEIKEYYFDTLMRLTGEKVCQYKTVSDTALEYVPVAITARKHAYDRDGRKIESSRIDSFCTINAESVLRTSAKLVARDNNHERWESFITDNMQPGEISKKSEIFHAKDSLTIIETDPAQGEIITVYTYDSAKRPAGYRKTCNNRLTEHVKYQYDRQGNLTASYHEKTPNHGGGYTRTFRYDHFDNESNWRKRMEYNENGVLIFIVIRNIEYR